VWSDEPSPYACPICAVVAGDDTESTAQNDVVYRDRQSTAFICPKWWAAAPAHALVVPNDHFENVYSMPDASLAAVYRTAKLVAVALRSAYDCSGTSMRQHNEPGGGQEVWHTSTSTSFPAASMTGSTSVTRTQDGHLRQSAQTSPSSYAEHCTRLDNDPSAGAWPAPVRASTTLTEGSPTPERAPFYCGSDNWHASLRTA
jgi:histidine triad (HIT) family protein